VIEPIDWPESSARYHDEIRTCMPLHFDSDHGGRKTLLAGE
jgi:hypothetical protein